MFKVGDKVRCIRESSGECGDSTYGGSGWEKGLEFTVTEINLHGNDYAEKGHVYWGGKNQGGVYGNWLELVKPQSEKLLIHCPTLRLWKKVLDKAFSEGKEWITGSKEYYQDYWDRAKENSVIDIEGNVITYWGFSRFTGAKVKQPNHKAMEAEEYLGINYKINCPLGEQNKSKGNTMSNIIKFAKELTLSADEKLLRKYGLKDECGEYTIEGRELVYRKLVADNGAYLIEIATKKEAEDKEKK